MLAKSWYHEKLTKTAFYYSNFIPFSQALSLSLPVLGLPSLCPQGYGVGCLPVVFFIKKES